MGEMIFARQLLKGERREEVLFERVCQMGGLIDAGLRRDPLELLKRRRGAPPDAGFCQYTILRWRRSGSIGLAQLAAQSGDLI